MIDSSGRKNVHTNTHTHHIPVLQLFTSNTFHPSTCLLQQETSYTYSNRRSKDLVDKADMSESAKIFDGLYFYIQAVGISIEFRKEVADKVQVCLMSLPPHVPVYNTRSLL